MKKTYIKPVVSTYDIELENMIATSGPGIDEEKVEGGSEGSRDENNRPSNPNLWDQLW